MISRFLFYGRALAALALLPALSQAQTVDGRQKLNAYLNLIGFAQLEQRARTLAAIETRDQAEGRKAQVRRKILELIGGLPESRGPVPVKQFGTVPGEGFRVEKVAYESLPSYFVTADVFVPTSGSGPFPAVIVTPGHGPAGKVGEYNWGVNLARAGILTMAIDTLGQGERLQHYDAELEASKVERSGEHEHAGLATLLIGQHVSRYFINDGIRGVDYLTQRKDVDPSHIGAFGCSGGGTATAYLAALDPRISVTATACYITSFKELLSTVGAQDAEQSLPRFLAEGLDLGDWVEMAAPRPYAIVSTTEDMFPFAGARRSYEEAKRIYSLYGAQDRLQWITGPGGHGNLGPIAPQIIGFLVQYLKNDSHPPAFGQFRPERPEDLLVTSTGQLSTSLGGETVESINRKVARSLVVSPKTVESIAALASLQTRVRADIRSVAQITAEPGAAPAVSLLGKEQRDGYRIETISLQSEPGIELSGLAAIPDRAGPKPAVLIMDELPKERVAATGDFERLVKSGHVVVIIEPRGTPAGAPVPSLLGAYTAAALRAMVVGKSIVGMRADDTIRAINWLASSPDVDRSSITLYGKGAQGMVALHAAALDPRITNVVVENTLTTYRMALDAPLHRNLSEIILPGVLLHYDVPDLLEAISPRPVVIANPVDAMGQPVRDEIFRNALAAVFESDRNQGSPQRVRLVRRGFREPLPL